MPDKIIPKHVGYIVDGNRRWATKHGLPSYEGHLAGYQTLIDVVVETINSGVEYVSVYTFSTENWKRSTDEVNKIMGLVLKLLTSDLHILEENNIRLKVLGSKENIKPKILTAIEEAELKTAKNTGGTLGVCFNYGGQLEIVDAVKKIVQSGIPDTEIDAELISKNIYVSDIPPVDLAVRTSGEHRISNFMLWRIAYSELLFIDKMWPDMKKADVKKILDEYSKRHRRIGK